MSKRIYDSMGSPAFSKGVCGALVALTLILLLNLWGEVESELFVLTMYLASGWWTLPRLGKFVGKMKDTRENQAAICWTVGLLAGFGVLMIIQILVYGFGDSDIDIRVVTGMICASIVREITQNIRAGDGHHGKGE